MFIWFSATKKVKVAHTRLPSVGFRSWSRFLTVSLQVMWVIKPMVGCHYFPPGLQTVTRQRRDCDWNPGPSAPESSTLTTRLPSHSLLLLIANFYGNWHCIAFYGKPVRLSIYLSKISQNQRKFWSRGGHGRRQKMEHFGWVECSASKVYASGGFHAILTKIERRVLWEKLELLEIAIKI